MAGGAEARVGAGVAGAAGAGAAAAALAGGAAGAGTRARAKLSPMKSRRRNLNGSLESFPSSSMGELPKVT